MKPRYTVTQAYPTCQDTHRDASVTGIIRHVGRKRTIHTSDIAIYWTAFTAGRLLIGGLVRFIELRQIIRVSAWILFAGMVIFMHASSISGSWIGLAISGMAVAPLFPLILAYTAERLGSSRASQLTPIYSVASNLSQTALSSLAGAVASIWGTGAIALYLVVVGMCLVVLTEMTLPTVRQHHGAS